MTFQLLTGRKNNEVFALISHAGLSMLRKIVRGATRFTFVYSVVLLTPRKSLGDRDMSLFVSMDIPLTNPEEFPDDINQMIG